MGENRLCYGDNLEILRQCVHEGTSHAQLEMRDPA